MAKSNEGSLVEDVKVPFLILVGSLSVFWVVEIIDVVLPFWGLDQYGIRPRTERGLWGILASPFLHGGFDHLIGNSVPFLILGWLTMFRERWHFALVTVMAMLLGGLGVWTFGATGSVHIGASGVIFGYLGFLLLSGFFERRFGAILVSLGVGVAYGGLVWGVLPSRPGISWEGHLFGFLAGILAAYVAARLAKRASG
ncbi:rhomboid family intramembrane serine protease [bacterium]|nr:rhomboid family intramembrane serine protease [bacterium]